MYFYASVKLFIGFAVSKIEKVLVRGWSQRLYKFPPWARLLKQNQEDEHGIR